MPFHSFKLWTSNFFLNIWFHIEFWSTPLSKQQDLGWPVFWFMVILFSLYMGKQNFSKFLRAVSYFQLCNCLVSLAKGAKALLSQQALSLVWWTPNMPKVMGVNTSIKAIQSSWTPCMSELGSGNGCHQTRGTQTIMLLSPLLWTWSMFSSVPPGDQVIELIVNDFTDVFLIKEQCFKSDMWKVLLIIILLKWSPLVVGRISWITKDHSSQLSVEPSA